MLLWVRKINHQFQFDFMNEETFVKIWRLVQWSKTHLMHYFVDKTVPIESEKPLRFADAQKVSDNRCNLWTKNGNTDYSFWNQQYLIWISSNTQLLSCIKYWKFQIISSNQRFFQIRQPCFHEVDYKPFRS